LGDQADFDVYRYDGSILSNVVREGITTEFSQANDGRTPVLLITYGAGGAGLNLAAASQVILVEPFWNDSTIDQAICRAHRLDQTRRVVVYRLEARFSAIDRYLLRACALKTAKIKGIFQRICRKDSKDVDVPEQIAG
jgi:SNF2 family DNA or RNA helicase